MQFILDNLEVILSVLVLALGALAGLEIKAAKQAKVIGEVVAAAIAKFTQNHGGLFPIDEDVWEVLSAVKEAFKEKEGREPNNGEVGQAVDEALEVMEMLKDEEAKK